MTSDRILNNVTHSTCQSTQKYTDSVVLSPAQPPVPDSMQYKCITLHGETCRSNGEEVSRNNNEEVFFNNNEEVSSNNGEEVSRNNNEEVSRNNGEEKKCSDNIGERGARSRGVVKLGTSVCNGRHVEKGDGCVGHRLNGSVTSHWSSRRNVRPFTNHSERSMSVCVPHVVVMVGLPARGKTYMARKLARYLNWTGIRTRVFNVGEYRRQATTSYRSHEFFRQDNEQAMAIRVRCALDALEDVREWLQSGNGQVAVFDATNTTFARRQLIYDICVVKNGFKCFFVESICDDNRIVESNVKSVKLTSPDYVGCDRDKALVDFLNRIDHYKECYNTIDEQKEDKLSYMKIHNAGEKVLVHKHEGHLQARIVYFYMNIHITPRTIFLTRHGESEYNIMGRLGGDSNLSARGEQYSMELADYIKSQNVSGLRVWTSWKKRTVQTAQYIEVLQERWKSLDEINAGVCEEMTYSEIQSKYPHDFAARDEDKLRYRYPRGESYEDLISRLEPVIMELERQESILLIGHQAVLRCLLAYFLDKPLEELPYLKIPLHTVMKLKPAAYGCELEYVNFDVNCVDTYRPRPPPDAAEVASVPPQTKSPVPPQ